MQTFVKHFLLPAQILATLLLCTSCFTTTAIKDNWALPVAADTPGKVEEAIKLACVDRDWICVKKPGQIYNGKLEIRSHSIELKIAYTTKDVTYSYISSENMNYDGQKIHKKYHMWIDRLHMSIKEHLRK